MKGISSIPEYIIKTTERLRNILGEAAFSREWHDICKDHPFIKCRGENGEARRGTRVVKWEYSQNLDGTAAHGWVGHCQNGILMDIGGGTPSSYTVNNDGSFCATYRNNKDLRIKEILYNAGGDCEGGKDKWGRRVALEEVSAELTGILKNKVRELCESRGDFYCLAGSRRHLEEHHGDKRHIDN